MQGDKQGSDAVVLTELVNSGIRQLGTETLWLLAQPRHRTHRPSLDRD
jgi:hypothetical protein